MPVTDITLNNPQLLKEALTHRSYLNENPQVSKHNERLEFLGDAVLELAVSRFLFDQYQDKPEGELTAYRASLVRTTTLAQVAITLNLGSQLCLSKGEELSGGRENVSLLANTFEAVLGAIYLDQGFDSVVSFLQIHLFPRIDQIIKDRSFKDYKSSLQEIVQSKGYESPVYDVLKEEGPDHHKIFTVAVFVNGKQKGIGEGKSKQAAQQEAARNALEQISNNW